MSKRAPLFGNKEDIAFREALKLYDSKQYKKALKLVDQNLKKHQNHAESLTLKGCIFHFTDNKSEAESYIKKGCSKAPNNHLVNHLAGIYYRNVDNYPQAAKWYKAAIDNGSLNKQILRDLGTMQVQIRDYKGLLTSRQLYLEDQPGYRANWTANAIAQHLNGDLTAAALTLSKIEGLIKDHLLDSDKPEHSECLLYKLSIFIEAGRYESALEALDNDQSDIKDKGALLKYKAFCLLKLDRGKEAALIYRQLLQRNPDNHQLYHLLEQAMGTVGKGGDNIDLRLKLYDKLALFYPRSDPPKFLPLTFLAGDSSEFRTRASSYVLSQLKRGTPATFVNIKPLLKDHDKLKTIREIVHDFYTKEVPGLSPTVNVWTLYFLAQYYLYLGDLEAAKSYILKAVEHTPTLVELYIVKARIWKHLGLYDEAAEIMNEGRELDLQDRFINSKATKYYFRANEIDKAIDTITLFTKVEDNAVNGCKDLHVMQVNWVLLESAEAYARLAEQLEAKRSETMVKGVDGDDEKDEQAVSDFVAELSDNIDLYKGLALKRFHAVVKVFDVFYNDQLDFHSYCTRKGTPRDYLEMIRWEDHLHATPIYSRAIKGLAKLYLEIYDDQLQQLQKDSEMNQNATAAGNKKKDQKKHKKEKAQEMKKKEKLIAKVKSEDDDKDPLGNELLFSLRTNLDGTVLSRLGDLVAPLVKEAPTFANTWKLAFEVYIREKKYVLALSAIKKLNGIVSDKEEIALMVGRLRKGLELDDSANAAIKKVVELGLSSSFPEY